MSTKCKLHSKCVHACSISSQLVWSSSRAKSLPSSLLPRCASVPNAGLEVRQRGCAVLNKSPAPGVSVPTVSKPYPPVT